MAMALDVSPESLNIPNIDSGTGLMQVLFALKLKIFYGLRIGEIDGELCLRLSKNNKNTYLSMYDMFSAWNEVSKKYKDEQITKEEYDQWRYNYPKALVEETVEDLRAIRNGEEIENKAPKPRMVNVPSILSDLDDN